MILFKKTSLHNCNWKWINYCIKITVIFYWFGLYNSIKECKKQKNKRKCDRLVYSILFGENDSRDLGKYFSWFFLYKIYFIQICYLVGEGCNCDWKSKPGACSRDDGSFCWLVCCRGGGFYLFLLYLGHFLKFLL